MAPAQKEMRWVSSGKHFATAAGGNDEALVEEEAKKMGRRILLKESKMEIHWQMEK